ncbi:MoeB/ThiF family adenylyltransferase [Bacillus sp. KH172YL63]|uniref:MoeB/ThiF family adenylyltransferase n=1 Tax=Bacillus sp. KH172YL63 TaxID=2709784 RepID=UPI0013E43090|nr:MoeB/ThiF family adenylyltransferase [Bacillus sp. KH172YL63]BCB03818.1 thiazole biosynthesis adenylyltransferase ThiF [Bacillus sp. KH172YL63]
MTHNRYSRQTLFSPIGVDGQRKIQDKHVLIVGAGALGTGNAEALVRAGVGKLTIVDRDYVEWSNLQRQQLYKEQDAIDSLPKAVAAKNRLQEINSTVEVSAHVRDVLAEDLLDLLNGVDLMIDATDNFETRMMMNDAAHLHDIPWVYGACAGSYGISFAMVPGVTPCLQCLIHSVPTGGMTCDTAGIISPAVSSVTALQTTEALKILVEDASSLSHRIVSFDLWKNEYSSLSVGSLKKEDCPSCGHTRTYPYLQYANQTKTAVLCGREAVQIRPASPASINLKEFALMLSTKGKEVMANPYLISFNEGALRFVLFKDGRAIIHGTKETDTARTVYHRYMG